MNKSAQALGRLGGLAKSKAKTAAVRANGKLGGRPKKPKRVAPVARPGRGLDCFSLAGKLG
jgi:hypothetical protein